MRKYKIFKFCQGCIGKWQRVKGNANYCIGCLNKKMERENNGKK